MKTPQFINLQDAVSGKWFLVNATHVTWIHRFGGNGLTALFNSGHSMILHNRQAKRLLQRLHDLRLT